MPTTPTSIVKRLMGTEAFTDALNFGGVAQTFAAGTTIGGAFVGTNAPVDVTASTLTLSQASHSGKIVLLDRAAGIAVTPPAATGTGDVYILIVATTVTSNTTTIDAKAGAASDIFVGFNYQFKSGTGLTVYGTAANTNLITMDGSTQGGIKGDIIIMRDVATNFWSLLFYSNGTGTVATPFSNH